MGECGEGKEGGIAAWVDDDNGAVRIDFGEGLRFVDFIFLWAVHCSTRRGKEKE